MSVTMSTQLKEAAVSKAEILFFLVYPIAFCSAASASVHIRVSSLEVYSILTLARSF